MTPAPAAALPPLALSTMVAQRWPATEGLAPFLALARRLGFSRIELSHILSQEALSTLRPMDQPQVATVHHPCPRPPGWRDAYALTSSDPAARQRAARALADSLRTAHRLGAQAVVLHLGPMPDDAEETGRRLAFELEARQRAGQGRNPAYRSALDALLAWRARREPEVLEHAWSELRPLLTEAARLDLRLGLETGYSPLELPSPQGMAWLLDQAAASSTPGCLGAWLDTGHVGAQVTLGVATWEAWWSAVGRRWVGVHLHDHVGLRDHLLPGMGQLDLPGLAQRLGAIVAATLEVDWYFSEAELADCLTHLAAQGWRT